MSQKQVTFAIIGLGSRGFHVYGSFLAKMPGKARIIAVADPDPECLERAKKEWRLPDDCCFSTAEDLLAQPRLADAAVIATQDKQHVAHAEAALKAGYHLLLEKPVATDIEGCLTILHLAEKYRRHVVVCHVLRYAPFYSTLKKMITEGRIGDVVSIQAMEQIGYWHFAHSYVRGNWRNTKESSPMILAKCCHDMDILLWLAGKHAQFVSSYGGTYLFRREKAPEGSADRCFDCKLRRECPYDAVRYYLEDEHTSVTAGNVNWPINVLSANPTSKTIEEALRTGPYGRCVYRCDNDAADHQAGNICLEVGVTIIFTASAFTENCYRTIKVMGTRGCIEGNMELSKLIWNDFFGNTEEIDLSKAGNSLAGHGGGDEVMIQEFIELLAGGSEEDMLSSIRNSIESHVVALLAEQSRLENGRSLLVKL